MTGIAATRPAYEQAIEKTAKLCVLAPFEQRIVGTLPLGVAIEASDIAVVCTSTSGIDFTAALESEFGVMEGFSVRQWA